jgi:rubredoxin-NAD+ reductase
LDPHRPITLVTACSGDRYDKPRLSVAFKQGVTAAQLVKESGHDAAQRLEVRLLAHTHAFSADAAARTLRTTRGTFGYEALVLAHGSSPRSCPGLPDDITWRVNDLRSYMGLRDALAQHSSEHPASRRVLIVGAGLVGCELGNDLALAGHTVTLLDVADRPLALATPAQSQDLLRAWATLPIEFMGRAQVLAARRHPAPDTDSGLSPSASHEVKLTLRDGRVLHGDVLVSAVGLRTPSLLAQRLGLAWADGIVVDPQTLSTGVARVHALGDCVSLNGRAQRYIEPIHRQAKVLAARLCGRPELNYEAAPPMVRVKTSSMPLTLAA